MAVEELAILERTYPQAVTALEFNNPFELRWAQKLVRLREPRLESL